MKKYHGLVNRRRVIATLEDKANITGYRWTLPQKIPQGFIENHSRNGEFLHNARTGPVTIRDVDGRDKHTICTAYYEQDQLTLKEKPKPAVGEWVEGLAGRYHGRNSRNWEQEHLTLNEIIEVLNAGFAFAPGRFNPPEGESLRSGDYCEHRQIILLDGDEWTDRHPSPPDFHQLLELYPDLPKDFYWVGESISSRSSLKPELRTRLLLVLPKPIYKGETELWETVIDALVTKYPFIARGVGVDKVRLSFGNARPECENRVLGAMVSLDTFTQWQHIAREKSEKAQALRLQTQRLKAERTARLEKDNALKTELARRGHAIDTENKDPIYEFCEADPVALLTDYSLATHLAGNAWNWHDSSPGRSFELSDGIIKPFSNTMQTASPETEGTKPVNAHRFILYYLHKLDISRDRDKHELRCILADAGYGRHPDVYKQSKRAVKVAGVREGLVSPLEIRSAAPPLPKEHIRRALQTLEQNAPEIAKAFQQKARVVGLRSGTGEGKTEYVIILAVEGSAIAMSLNTIPLAAQVYDRFDKAETQAFLWHSRWYGYQNKKQVNLIPLRQRIRAFERGDLLCIKPHLCKASQDRGVTAPVAVCSRCEVQDACRAKGYLSQTEIAQQTQALCIAQPKLFIDPTYRGFFKQLSKGQPSDRICVIDEAKAHNMFLECSLSKAVLQQWVSDFSGEYLGEFAEMVLEMLEVHSVSPYEVAALVDKFEDKDLRELSRQCVRYRLPYKRIRRGYTDKKSGNALAYHCVEFQGSVSAYIAVDYDAYDLLQAADLPTLQPQEVSEQGYMTLTPSQAFALGVYKPGDLQGINALPRLWETSNWTPFQQLKAFIERYKREVDAPIWYSDGVLYWVIPPVVHKRVKRLVCMSATLQKEAFERAFDSVETTFIETPPTHWVDGAKAFQVRTGAYPRRSLFDSVYDPEKKKWQPLRLTDSGGRYLGYIENEVARDKSVKHVLITMKGILDLCGKELTKTHKNLTLMSFHKMEGLDFTDSGVVFWIFGCPEVSEDIIAWRAKVLYGNDSEALNYDAR